MRNAIKTGLMDMNGEELLVGSSVQSDRGYVGVIRFGTYGNGHYGVYIEWKDTPGVDRNFLRQDILFWAEHICSV